MAELLTRRGDDGGGRSARYRRGETGARSVDVVTFGCRLNAYEFEAIARAGGGGRGDRRGGLQHLRGDRPRRCARRARRSARPAASGRARGWWSPAAPPRSTRRAFAAMPEVDLVLGNADKAAPGALRRGAGRPGRRHLRGSRTTRSVRSPAAEGRARAYVEVQNGCDHRCTFCIIPFGRGNSRSVAAGRGGRRRCAASRAPATPRWC